MALIAITSPGGAPGVTTSALAWTLAWPSDALLAECSPAGGSVLAGFFRSQLPPHQAQRGLWPLNLAAMEHGPDAAAHLLWDQLVVLGEQPRRMLLPGLADPFLAPQLAESWSMLAELFRALPADVLVDVGPLGPPAPFALLAAADLVLVVMRPTMAQTVAAVPRVQHLRHALGPNADVGLCVIGSSKPSIGDELHYSLDTVRRHLGDFALTLALPEDPKSAVQLSDGIKGRRNVERGPLLLEARRTAALLHGHLDAQYAMLRRRTAPALNAPPPGHDLQSSAMTREGAR